MIKKNFYYFGKFSYKVTLPGISPQIFIPISEFRLKLIPTTDLRIPTPEFNLFRKYIFLFLILIKAWYEVRLC